MVAPSFQNYELLGSPYEKNKKHYIKARNPKTGTEREVRWYNDIEYSKQFNGGKPIVNDGFKKARGFKEGYITVLRNTDIQENLEWCEKSNARYAVGVGWYIISEEPVPSTIPATIKQIPLTWEEFHAVGDEMRAKPAETLAKIIKQKEKDYD